MNYDLGDILILKKPHPCFKKTDRFLIVRMGADIRIKCTGCGKTFLIPREELNTKIKEVIKK